MEDLAFAKYDQRKATRRKPGYRAAQFIAELTLSQAPRNDHRD